MLLCVCERVPQWCNDSPWEQDPGLRLPSDSLLSTERRDKGGGGRGRVMVVKEKTMVATAAGSSGQ